MKIIHISTTCKNVNFRDIGSVTIYGVVKEKAAAKQQYDDAVRQGQSAGHVAASYVYEFLSHLHKLL